MKKNLWALLSLTVVLLFNSSSKSPDIIYWADHSRLSWSDFQAYPRFDYESIAALTSSGIVHYTGCENGKITYKVRAYFEKHESWVKEEARTQHHLKHEQIHFDITELYARKLRKLLSEQTFLCGQEAEFELFVKNALAGWQQEQQNFDIYTRHSMDKEHQREWFYKIEMELSLLENFKE